MDGSVLFVFGKSRSQLVALINCVIKITKTHPAECLFELIHHVSWRDNRVRDLYCNNTFFFCVLYVLADSEGGTIGCILRTPLWHAENIDLKHRVSVSIFYPTKPPLLLCFILPARSTSPTYVSRMYSRRGTYVCVYFVRVSIGFSKSDYTALWKSGRRSYTTYIHRKSNTRNYFQCWMLRTGPNGSLRPDQQKIVYRPPLEARPKLTPNCILQECTGWLPAVRDAPISLK